MRKCSARPATDCPLLIVAFCLCALPVLGLSDESVELAGRQSTFQLGPFKASDGASDEFRLQGQQGDCGPGTIIGHTKNFNLFLSQGREAIGYGDQLRGFNYLIYLRRRDSPKTCTPLNVAAIPQGRFLDDVVDLPLAIGAEAGGARLPIHSLNTDGFLTLEDASSIFSVDLGTSGGLRLKVRNHLPALGILVHSATVVPREPRLWEPLNESIPLNVSIPGNEEVILPPIDLEPKGYQALLSQVRADKFDTIVDVALNFQPEFGGIAAATQSIPVQIRFVPTIPFLLFTAVLGGGLGSTLRHLADNRKKQKASEPFNIIVDTTVNSLMVELVGIGFYALKSRLVIFGFEVNPYSFVSVFFVSLVVVGFFRIPVLGVIQKTFFSDQVVSKQQ